MSEGLTLLSTLGEESASLTEVEDKVVGSKVVGFSTPMVALTGAAMTAPAASPKGAASCFSG